MRVNPKNLRFEFVAEIRGLVRQTKNEKAALRTEVRKAALVGNQTGCENADQQETANRLHAAHLLEGIFLFVNFRRGPDSHPAQDWQRRAPPLQRVLQ